MPDAQTLRHWQVVASVYCHTKDDWKDEVPEYQDALWLVRNPDGYFAFGEDAETIATICGCEALTFRPYKRDVSFIRIGFGKELEDAMDKLLDAGRKNVILCGYEGVVGASALWLTPFILHIQQLSMFV